MTTEQLEDRKNVSKAFQFSAINQALNRILTFVSGIIIMRIVSPSDVGTFAAATAIVIFCTSFNDISMTPAVIQWKGRVSQAARTGASIAMLGSIFLYAVIFIVAPHFGNWINDEHLSPVLKILGIAILIDGVGTIPLALLTRAMRQKRILVIESISLLIQIVVTVTLAQLGHGAYALVWGMLLSNGFSAIMMLASAPEAGIPGFHLETAKRLIRFGAPLTLSNAFHIGTVQVDNIVVGRSQGTTQLGYYQLGYNGGNLPENTIGATVGRVSFAWFSNIRDNIAHQKKAFQDLTLGLLATTLPFVVLLSVMSEELVHVLYGEKWAPAADIVRILAYLGGIRVFLNFFTDILAANGKPWLELRIYALWFVALIPALIIGSHVDGIEGVAYAHVATGAIVVVPLSLIYIAREGFSLKTTASHGSIFVVAAALQAITSYSLNQMISSPFWSLIIAGGAGGAVFILVSFTQLNKIRKAFTRPDHGFGSD